MSPDAIVAPSNVPWADTGIDVVAGKPLLTIVGKERVAVSKLKKVKDDSECEVGPRGTFFYGNRLVEQEPAGAAAAKPVLCLIGRIGNDPAFYVGREQALDRRTDRRLWLGINDFDVTDNVGEFYAEVTRPSDVQPVSFRQEIPLASEGASRCNCSVIVFYIDGLRHDVVRKMAYMGHIPNLRSISSRWNTWPTPSPLSECQTRSPSTAPCGPVAFPTVTA